MSSNLRWEPLIRMRSTTSKPIIPAKATTSHLRLAHLTRLQANSAPQIQRIGRSNPIHHGLRSYHSFGWRRWPYQGKILYHGLRRSTSQLVLPPTIGLHHKLALAKSEAQARLPRLRSTRLEHHRKLPVSPRRQRTPL